MNLTQLRLLSSLFAALPLFSITPLSGQTTGTFTDAVPSADGTSWSQTTVAGGFTAVNWSPAEVPGVNIQGVYDTVGENVVIGTVGNITGGPNNSGSGLILDTYTFLGPTYANVTIGTLTFDNTANSLTISSVNQSEMTVTGNITNTTTLPDTLALYIIAAAPTTAPTTITYDGGAGGLSFTNTLNVGTNTILTTSIAGTPTITATGTLIFTMNGNVGGGVTAAGQIGAINTTNATIISTSIGNSYAANATLAADTGDFFRLSTGSLTGANATVGTGQGFIQALTDTNLSFVTTLIQKGILFVEPSAGGTVINSNVTLPIDNNTQFNPNGAATFITFNGTSGPAELLTDTSFALPANRTVTINASSAAVLAATAGTTATYNGIIADQNATLGTLAIGDGTNTGTVSLAAVNTYAAPTSVAAGATLNLAKAQAVQNSTVTVNATGGLTFAPTIGTFLLGGLSGAGGIALADTTPAPVTLQVGSNNASTTYSGSLTGTGGALTKVGTGTLALTGSNVLSGGLNIHQGTVKVGVGNSVGTGIVTIGATGLAGTLDLNGQTETIAGLATAGTAASQTITNSNATSAVVNYTGATSTFGGNITGATGVTVASGNLTLSGTGNTYTGPTTVSAGTLNVTGSIANSAVTISSGATLTAGTVTTGAVTVNSGGRINLQNGAIGTLATGNLTIGTGAGTSLSFDVGPGATNNLDKITAGTLTVNGTGGTTINIANAMGTATLSAGTYSLITYTGAQLTTTAFDNFTLAGGTPSGTPGSIILDDATLTLVNTANALQLIIAPPASQFTLTTTAGGASSVSLHANGTTTISTTVTSSTPDTLAYTTLNAGVTSGSGTLGAATGNTAGTVTQGQTSSALTQTFTAGATGGSTTITPTATVTDVTTPATIPTGATSPATINVYNLASANTLTPNPIAFGNFHVGSAPTQTVAVTNTATVGGFSEKLDAATATTGGATVSGSPISLLAAGSSANLTVGVTNAAGVQNGTVSVTLNSDGTGTSGLGTTALATQTITVTGTGYRLAAPNNFSANTVAFGNFHVGMTPAAQMVTVTNTATADGFSESLDAAATTTGGATVTGSPISLLAAGASAHLSVGISGAAGNDSGTVVVALNSDGTGTSGLGNTALASQTITVTGAGYNLASAAGAQTVAIGNTHVGTADTAALVLTNTAPSGSFTEALDSNGFTGTGAGISAAGSVSGIAGGGSGSGALKVGLSATTAGAVNGTTTLALLSDGTGIDGLGTTAIGNQTITVTGGVYDFAHAKYTGATLAFGIVHQTAAPTTLSQTVAFGNQTVTNATFQDLLNVSATTGNGLVTPTGFAGLAASAGGATTQNLTLSANTNVLGSLASTETLTLGSDGTTSGLGVTTAAVVGTPSAITTSGQVYSGQSVWTPVNPSGSGSWGSLAIGFGANWGANQGSPGLDPGFVDTDSATFNTISTAATVTLDDGTNPVNPSLNAITFNTTGAGYTIAPGAGGTLKLNGGAGSATITDTAGSNTITAPVELDSNTAATVARAGDTLTLSGNISEAGGSHGLTLSGTGTTVLSGGNTYTGGTTITAGTLLVGPNNINTQLGAGNVMNTGGILGTTGGQHLINVGGNYTQGAGGTLVININNPAGATTGTAATNDLLVATGTADINGTIALNFTLSPVPKKGDVFQVVESGGATLEASAKAVVINPAGFQIGASLSPTAFNSSSTVVDPNPGDNIYVTITSTQLGLSDLLNGGGSPNQIAILNYIDSGAISGPLFTALSSTLAAGGATAATATEIADEFNPVKFATFTRSTVFNTVVFSTQMDDGYFASQRSPEGDLMAGNGQIDSSSLTVAGAGVDSALASVSSRLLAWSPAPLSHGLLSDSSEPIIAGVDTKEMKPMSSSGPDHPINTFVAGNVVLGQNFSQAGLAHSDSTSGGVQIGGDYRITPHLRAGVLFGYNHTDGDLDNNGSTATIDSYAPGVYATYAEKGWYANAVGNYGFDNFTEDRSVSIGAVSASAHGAPSGDQISGDLDGGYDFHLRNWTFGPLVGAQYTHLDVGGFTEDGAQSLGSNESVNKQETDSMRSRLGGHVSYLFHTGTMTLTPHLDASWQHEFMDQSEGINAQIVNVVGTPFTVKTPNPSRDSALIDAGLNADICSHVTLFGDYSVQAGQSNYFGQSIQAGVKIGF